MKKAYRIFLVFFSISFLTFGQDSSGESSSSQTVSIQLYQKTSNTPTTHRTPLHLNIEVYYNATDNTIEISYDGEEEGEVFIYLNDNIVGHSNIINTSIPLPEDRGTYQIEILGDTWIASGYLQI